MGKPVTLGVSGWRLHGQRTGVGRYLLNLIQNWTPDLVAGRFDRITIYTPVPFDGGDISLPEGISHKVLPPGLPMVAWENLRLGPFAGESVMLYPSFSRPLLTRGASVVVTHDATMRLHPELFTSRDKRFYDPLYGWSSRAATLVITTTNAAKADITREWNVEGEKIHVTHLASAECFRPLETSVDRSAMRQSLTGSDTPYFLFVGKLSGRRNLPKLLEAFAVFRRTTGHPHNLLMVGPQYAITALEKLADELGVRSHLITRTFVKDPELNDLYNCAHAFVMPSTYETVSFPIMEAQAAGTPVICIDTPGSREITGGDALLIPRLDTDDLVGAMTRMVTEPDLRASLSARGLKNAARFSWRRCADTTLSVCAEAAKLGTGRAA